MGACQMSLLFSLLLILALTARGMNVSLQPSDITVHEGQWASFNCSIDCEFRSSHTLRWLVGDSVRYLRSVYLSDGTAERQFFKTTGYQVAIEDHTNCNSAGEGRVSQILRIHATSVAKVNKTSIQCAAFRETIEGFDFLSYYAVLLVRANNTTPSQPGTPLPTPSTCVATETVTVSPSQADPSACSQNLRVSQSATITATRVVTETVTVTHIILKSTDLPILGSGNSSATSLIRSSLLTTWTVYLFSLILTLSQLFVH